MNEAILQDNVQEFISSFDGDITELAFKGSPFPEIQVQELLTQISGRRKTKKKLPAWHNAKEIYFPPKLNLEQASSEVTASYKADLLKSNVVADLTGGFGVDSYYFSLKAEHVDYYETNAELAAVALHNFKKLGCTNIEGHIGDSLSLIKNERFDTIYIDPARRHDVKGKVFLLSDCEPDVVQNLDYLLERCDRLLIKTSPMLDLTMGYESLKHVQAIHLVAVDNDLKEILWVLENSNKSAVPKIYTANYQKERMERLELPWEDSHQVSFSEPLEYLYEPNVAIMKAGKFNHITVVYDIAKLHLHSHLYTSAKKIDFPGRTFRVKEVIPYSKSGMRDLQIRKANITTRNFPESVSKIRNKWKIKEGGQMYLFFTTDMHGEKVVIRCERI